MISGVNTGTQTTYQTMTLNKMNNNGATPYDTAKYVIQEKGLAIEMPFGWWDNNYLTQALADAINTQMNDPEAELRAINRKKLNF